MHLPFGRHETRHALEGGPTNEELLVQAGYVALHDDELATLLEQGYPLSEEQTEAIRAVAGAQGRVAIVEGAAGSGKTTTLRPIADLFS